MKKVAVTNKTYSEGAGVRYEGKLEDDGYFKLSGEYERSYLLPGEFDLVPEGAKFSVTVWVDDEEELGTVLQELKHAGFINTTEVKQWS